MNAPSAILDNLPRDLGNGLLLRRSTRADAEPLAEFNRWIHRDSGVVEPDEGVAAWTRELLSGQHPTFGEGDFTLVVEKDKGRIVSALNLISQTWSYAGIPFGVGRIELVGTAPEYRKRGLIRAQFDLVHVWSASRGEQVQSITGIPYYYRQFGYELALDLGGGRIGYTSAVPSLKEGQTEPFLTRRLEESDLPFVLALDAHSARHSLINLVRDERMWRFELFGRLPGNVNRLEWRILETVAREPIGLIAFSGQPWGGGTRLGIMWFELAPGWSYVETGATVLRAMRAEGEAVVAARGKQLTGLQFSLGVEHPLYDASFERLPQTRLPYAWYLRVPDLTLFMRTIAPALEERLERSGAAGHSGELKVSFYRSGLRFALQRGRFSAIEPWMPASYDDEGDAGFPGLTFLQMLFGYRDFVELRTAFPDVWAGSDEARGLLTALFPRLRTKFIALV